MNPRRLIITLYGLMMAVIAVAAGAVFLDAQAQYKQLMQAKIANEQRLAAAQARLHEQEIILQRLKADPDYVERAIRQRLKYAKPDEYIFRFPD